MQGHHVGETEQSLNFKLNTNKQVLELPGCAKHPVGHSVQCEKEA